MSKNKHLGFDRHGLKNVLAEKFVNVSFDRSKIGSEIQGCTVNNLLRGLFYINGCIKPLQSHDLPGGIPAWDDLLECVYITISYFLNVSEVTRRVLVLAHLFQYSGGVRHGHILTGALSFLFTWAGNFNAYLTDHNLLLLREGILDIVNELCRPGGIVYHFSMTTSIPQVASTALQILGLCEKLEDMISRLTSERACLRRGLNFRTTYAGSSDESHFHLNDFSLLRRPSLPVIIGTWTGQSREASQDQLKAIAQTPLKIDIFGANSLFDDLDTDDEVASAIPASTSRFNSELSDSLETIPPHLKPRIPNRYSLLQDPSTMDIWDFDINELARQWTLVEHSLFVSIPLVGLLTPTWSQPRFRLPEGGAQVRRFIDRFNATSAWATHAVLQGASAELRAKIYGNLVALACAMEHLTNYSSVMAIVSALQQACITRLTATLALVDKSDKDNMSRLQRLMAGEKNYVRYREEMKLKELYFLDMGEWKSRADGLLATSKKISDDVHDSKDALSSDKRSSGGRGGGRSSRNSSSEFVGAVVPHLGAHLAELATIHEGNPDYLPHHPQSLNMAKLRLLSRSLGLVSRMQRLRYPFVPVRLVAAVINRVVERHAVLLASDATEQSREFYNMSIMCEGPFGVPVKHGDLAGRVGDDAIDEFADAHGDAEEGEDRYFDEKSKESRRDKFADEDEFDDDDNDNDEFDDDDDNDDGDDVGDDGKDDVDGAQPEPTKSVGVISSASGNSSSSRAPQSWARLRNSVQVAGAIKKKLKE